MRLRLIANPTASGVSRALVDAVAALLAEVADVELALTERSGHAVELARGPGADVVVAMGGDGTVNEVVNGLPPGVELGVVPAGATSVFARQLGLPRKPIAAAAVLAAALRTRSSRAVGLGVANGRTFTFSAGMGLEAEATRVVDEERHTRYDGRRPGDLKVVAAAVRTLRSDGFALPERMTIELDGRRLRCSYLAVANQHPYTYFGRLPVRTAPRAGFATALDVVVVGELRSRDLWRLPFYGLVWPVHARRNDRRVAYLHDVESFDVICDQPVSLQLDGEYLGRFERVEVRYRRDAVRVVIPPAAAPARGRASAAAGR
jgi:diacylglycerol kinase family enzyme